MDKNLRQPLVGRGGGFSSAPCRLQTMALFRTVVIVVIIVAFIVSGVVVIFIVRIVGIVFVIRSRAVSGVVELP